MKRILLVAIGIVAVTVAGIVALSDGPSARANPPGAPDGKKVGQFNYIAVPEGTEPNCGAGSSRIFTERGAGGQTIYWYFDAAGGALDVLDSCTTAVDGDQAVVSSDMMATYKVYVVLLGPKSADNWLSICRQDADDLDVECELGSITLDRGGGIERWTFPKKLFDDGFEDELWQMEQGTKFRIAQIRLYLEE